MTQISFVIKRLKVYYYSMYIEERGCWKLKYVCPIADILKNSG